MGVTNSGAARIASGRIDTCKLFETVLRYRWQGQEIVQTTGGSNGAGPETVLRVQAKFRIGQIVRHRVHPFRGVIFDVDPEFSNTEEWWQSIPEELRPRKDQPFYHLLAENETSYYVAYVSEQNLVPDPGGGPVDHPNISEYFTGLNGDQYAVRPAQQH